MTKNAKPTKRGERAATDDAYQQIIGALSRTAKRRKTPLSLVAPLERLHHRRLPRAARELVALHERFDLGRRGVGFWDLLPASDFAIAKGAGNLFEALVVRDQKDFNHNFLLMQYAAALLPVGVIDQGDLLFVSLGEKDEASEPVAYWAHEGDGELLGIVAGSLPVLGHAALLARAIDDESATPSAIKKDAQAIKGRFQFKWVRAFDDLRVASSCKSSSDADLTYVRAAPIAYALSPYLASNAAAVADDDSWSPLEDAWEQYPHDDEHFEDSKRMAASLARYSEEAFYWLFRSFFLDERSELEVVLRRCEASAAPLIRDMARLVRELANGRRALGRIKDIRKVARRVQEVARR